MPESQAPRPSMAPAGVPGSSGGSGPYAIGFVVLAALAGGTFYFVKSKDSAPAPKPETKPAATASAAPQAPMGVSLPPPPQVDDAPAASASAAASAKAPAVVGAGGPSPCAKCGDGKASGALQSALQATAQSARGCYQRALRNGEVSGSLTVSVQVGPNGQTCGASVVSDSIGSSEITNCVLGKFRGHSFPPPEAGCVVVNIPLSFTVKQ